MYKESRAINIISIVLASGNFADADGCPPPPKVLPSSSRRRRARQRAASKGGGEVPFGEEVYLSGQPEIFCARTIGIDDFIREGRRLKVKGGGSLDSTGGRLLTLERKGAPRRGPPGL